MAKLISIFFAVIVGWLVIDIIIFAAAYAGVAMLRKGAGTWFVLKDIFNPRINFIEKKDADER